MKDLYWSLAAIIFTAGVTVRVYINDFKNLFAWNRKRKLKTLKKEVKFFEKLKESDRELYIFLFSSLISIAVLIGILLYFRSTLVSIGWEKGVVAADWFFGLTTFLFSVHRLGQVNRLKNYDKTMSYLKQQIEKLEPKTKD